MDFAIPFQVLLSNNEEKRTWKDKQIFRPFQRRKKKKTLGNMKVTVILIVVRALGTVPTGFEKSLKELKLEEELR